MISLIWWILTWSNISTKKYGVVAGYLGCSDHLQVPTVFIFPDFLVSPIIVNHLMLFFWYCVGDLQWIEDTERNDCVVSVKVNVNRLTCWHCSTDEKCKE